MKRRRAEHRPAILQYTTVEPEHNIKLHSSKLKIPTLTHASRTAHIFFKIGTRPDITPIEPPHKRPDIFAPGVPCQQRMAAPPGRGSTHRLSVEVGVSQERAARSGEGEHRQRHRDRHVHSHLSQTDPYSQRFKIYRIIYFHSF